ncbi:MAG: XrtA/PEP-CTERM system histidine kinase PrsK [Halopseudomonas sp.]
MALLGFSASFIVFLIMLILCLVIWRERLLGVWLQLALFTTTVWAGYIAFSDLQEGFNPANQVFVELLRNMAWLLFMLKLFDFGRGGKDFWSLKSPWLVLLGSIGLLILNIVEMLGVSLFVDLGVSLPYLAPLVLVTAVLVVTEQWFRNIPTDQRWSVKFLLIGVCLVFGYDFLLYSEALLFKRIDPEFWQARGFVSAMAAPLIAISVSRTRDWNRELRISRQAIFFSTTLLLSGLYLLVMSLVGYYLRWFGNGVGSAVQIIFIVVALTLFVLLISSGRFRSLVAVWLNKHFLSYKYDYRDEWMKANSRFAALPLDERYYQELLIGIADPVDSNGGVLWIKEGGQFVCQSAMSVDYRAPLTTVDDQVLLDFLERTGWIVNLKEYRHTPEHYPNLGVSTSLASVGLWLLVPLLHQSRLVGVVGLAPPRAEQPVNWEDFDLLKALGGQLAALIELKRTSESLLEARQFEAFNRLSAFVVHDLKNIVAQLSLVVSNAARHKHNPEFVDDALDTLANAVARMNRLLSQLRKQSHLLVQQDVIDLDLIAAMVIKRQVGSLPLPVLSQVHDGLRVKIDTERLVDVVCHLVQNSQDATPDDGRVQVSVEKQGEEAILSITDTGCGMDQEFIRTRLFKPFDTTKGSAGMGIGVYEAQQFVKENDGWLEVESQPGQGTKMIIRLPVFQVLDQQREKRESKQGA